MTSFKRSRFAALGAGLASLTLACASHKQATDDDVQMLVARSKEANAALLRGDIDRYSALVALADDFTLMSPFGGQPRLGAPRGERLQAIGKFFKNGSLQQELVHAYGSADMVVLAIIERAHVEVGGLPAQDWALRVTLVYRRDHSGWRLVHRHADPLAHGISIPEAAELARGHTVTKG